VAVELPAAALSRLADAAERLVEGLAHLAPPPAAVIDWNGAVAFRWRRRNGHGQLLPVTHRHRIDLADLQGVDTQKKLVDQNTRQFVQGAPANNVLLTGARGTGKSSLVKAVHAQICATRKRAVALVEIHREDIPSLPKLLSHVRQTDRRIVIFCDDLSFDGQDAAYKSLKAVLDGGIEGRPDNVVFYATSNRRHLMPRDMIENERSTAINPAEAVEEKVSLSDRFGLWLGFHNADQDTYFAMIEGYAQRYGFGVPVEELRRQANEWSVTRGARSGRVAWQFVVDLAGRLGKRVD
jgi:uncharacterized protein